MNINGKEIKMRYSVRARLNIAALCPGGAFTRLGDLFDGAEENIIQSLIKVGMILNAEYERNQALERGEKIDPNKDYSLFTPEEVYDLDYDQLSELEKLITETIFGDSRRTVESKPVKTGKKTERSQKSTS